MDAGDVFDEAVGRISQEYDRLGHSLGWSFLYTPRRTLTPPVALMFAGYNPGGNRYEAPRPSVEDGNAFRVQRWPGNGPRHQERVVRLLTEVGKVIAPETPSMQFIDGTLTANFCPYRSPSTAKVHRRAESLVFSETLWSMLFTSVLPHVVVANGMDAAILFQKPLTNIGFKVVERERFKIGWGSYTYEVTSLRRGEETMGMFGLPHLSRFDIRDPHDRSALVHQIAQALDASERSRKLV